MWTHARPVCTRRRLRLNSATAPVINCLAVFPLSVHFSRARNNVPSYFRLLHQTRHWPAVSNFLTAHPVQKHTQSQQKYPRTLFQEMHLVLDAGVWERTIWGKTGITGIFSNCCTHSYRIHSHTANIFVHLLSSLTQNGRHWTFILNSSVSEMASITLITFYKHLFNFLKNIIFF